MLLREKVHLAFESQWILDYWFQFRNVYSNHIYVLVTFNMKFYLILLITVPFRTRLISFWKYKISIKLGKLKIILIYPLCQIKRSFYTNIAATIVSVSRRIRNWKDKLVRNRGGIFLWCLCKLLVDLFQIACRSFRSTQLSKSIRK